MAADTFQVKRGTTAAVNAYLPAVGEPVYDITLKRFTIGDGVTLGGVAPSNSFTADKLTTARDIALTGSVTGTVSFDGSANVSMVTSVGASLQASLDLKAPLASPIFTGVPSVPTAAPLTNTTQAASTAFVDATRVVLVAVDALKAPLASPALTGVPTAPTAATTTSTTQLATTAFVQQEIGVGQTWTNFTLQNSWTVIASRRAAYRKVLGQVQIEFQAAGGTATDGTVMATLPVGFRPAFPFAIPVAASTNVAPAVGTANSRVVIGTDGTITCQNVNSAQGASFSLLMPLN